MKPCAEWTDDCQGKKDYDGPIITIATRYWPDHTANAALLLHHQGDPIPLIEVNISDDSLIAVQAKVEVWVHEQYATLIDILRKHYTSPDDRQSLFNKEAQ